MNTSLARGLVALFGALLVASPALGSQMSFIALLHGAQASPPITDSNGQGLAHMTLDTGARELCYAISFDGLSGPAIAMHFHGPAVAGENAGIVLDLSAALESPIAGCASGLSSSQMSDLKDGLWYLNVHTGNHPGGEIRGQVERVGTVRGSRGSGRLPIR